jgi:glutathione synthase
MQRIFPSPQNTAFLRNRKLEVLPSISELGIFGTFVGYGSSSLSSSPIEAATSDIVSPILNNYGGYLLRTKPLGVDEGGVATGYSVLNSIVLE